MYIERNFDDCDEDALRQLRKDWEKRREDLAILFGRPTDEEMEWWLEQRHHLRSRSSFDNEYEYHEYLSDLMYDEKDEHARRIDVVGNSILYMFKGGGDEIYFYFDENGNFDHAEYGFNSFWYMGIRYPRCYIVVPPDELVEDMWTELEVVFGGYIDEEIEYIKGQYKEFEGGTRSTHPPV